MATSSRARSWLPAPYALMVTSLAVLLATVLALLAVLHLYWAFGGPGGYGAVVPVRPDGDGSAGGSLVFDPGPVATAAVAVLLGAAAVFALGAAGVLVLPVPRGLIRFGIWTLAVVLLLRAIGDFRYVGLAKRVRGTRFATLDTRYFTPLCLVLSALAFGVAIGSG